MNRAVDLQNQLAGETVTIRFRQQEVPATTGVVVPPASPGRVPAYDPNLLIYSGRVPAPSVPSSFLALETENGLEYVDTSIIASITVPDGEARSQQDQPVLLLDASNGDTKSFRLSYIAQGLSWAPSYRLDISDPQTVSVEQQAVIKNELEPIREAKLFLISGHPSVELAHVTSPSLPNRAGTAFSSS